MALEECRECGGQISTEAETCPNCGVPDPTGSGGPERQATSDNDSSGNAVGKGARLFQVGSCRRCPFRGHRESLGELRGEGFRRHPHERRDR